MTTASAFSKATHGRARDRASSSYRPQARSGPLSPVLDQILNGGRCVALPVALAGRGLPPERRMFSSSGLNRSYLFKLPCPNPDADDRPSSRPIDTGVFVPYDEGDPGRGGLAIYIGERNSQQRFHDLVGVTLDGSCSAGNADARVLKLIDELPSLDPFLLKDSFAEAGLELDPAYCQMSEGDAIAVRAILARQLLPLLQRALRLSGPSLERKVERFVDAMFSPDLSEAKQFLRSFGIDGEQAPQVFRAWKGIAFYRSIFDRTSSPLNHALAWLKSRSSDPPDLSHHLASAERLLRLRILVIERIGGIIDSAESTFAACDRRFDELARRSDPAPFRNFLSTAIDEYWALGRAGSAMAHALAAFRSIGWPNPTRPSFDSFGRLVLSLDLAHRRTSLQGAKGRC